MIKRTLTNIAYPSTIALCISLFFILKNNAIPFLLATYIPLIVGASLVTILEYYIPKRLEWKGDKTDVKNDALFMLSVQMILPKLLAITLAIGTINLFELLQINVWTIWPNNLHIGIQVVLMVLIADFLRYWIHYASHNSKFLWRLHAVHHSPKKLYWLNVGRFHPLEKAIQFLFDALPFILLGVSEEVVALYFIFYGVNGFFQHCNIKLNLGLLNYVISGPELHRWHHSRIPNESNSNYGNNIIVWDLLFGTYFLPKNSEVGELGLINEAYPLNYSSQFLTPFSGDIDKKALPIQRLSGSFLNFFLSIRMKQIGAKHFNPFISKSKRPQETQENLLLKILNDNRNTTYGQKHNFSEIGDYETYKKNVPVIEYEDIRELVMEQDVKKKPTLTQENPFMFNQTSGTTGEPKYIPVLNSSLNSLRKTQQIFAYAQYKYCPEAFQGKILGMVSPALEGHLPTGTPIGSASGHIYKTMPKITRKKYVLPEEVFEIEDYSIKYYMIARLSVEEGDITYIGTANPSTYHKLLEVINSNIVSILSDIKNGRCKYLDQLPDYLSKAIEAELKPNPKRASYLKSTFNNKGQITFTDIWPYIKLIICWTGGSCGISLKSILDKFPQEARVVEAGYLASEFRGTVTIDPEKNHGIPTIHNNFFEFVEKEKWEDNQQDFQDISTLEMGKEYYIFITTTTGLYRYNMNDIVQVDGKYNATPVIQFIQKGKGATNITGEKLYEIQLIKAMEAAERKLNLKTCFYIVLANEEESCYELYYESETDHIIDHSLLEIEMESELYSLNMEYKTKRSGDRLKPLKIYYLKKGTFEKYKEHQLSKGVREGQFKITLLQYSRDLDFNIRSYANR